MHTLLDTPLRLIDAVEGTQPGPTVVVFGAIHGNEHASIPAIKHVLSHLKKNTHCLNGHVVGFRGNVSAISTGQRFIDRDLNRHWTLETVQRLQNIEHTGPLNTEELQQLTIVRLIEKLASKVSGPLILLDCHSTSAPSAPFCCTADTLRNRDIALALPIPLILGLEETIDGSMLGFFSDLGHVGLVVEAGQHDDPFTTHCHESAVWLTLAAARCLSTLHIPDYDTHYERLKNASADTPKVVEIRYRHEITPDDTFLMKPGFVNFQFIRKGQLLATDRYGDVKATTSGRMLMPLYQVQGEDGFFIGRDVHPFWLWISALLRQCRADILIYLVPGVKRHWKPHSVMLNAHLARGWMINILHLLGFRKREREGASWVFSRRLPDHAL